MILNRKLLSLLIAAAVFLAPINLFLKWGEAQAYVGGIFTDYLVNKFWIGEIPVLLVILFWLPGKIHGPIKKIQLFLKKNTWLILAFLLLIIRQFFSPIPAVSLWSLSKLIELGLFAWCLTDLWPRISHKLFQLALLLTILFQAGIASLQFFRQQPLFEYQVLGETQLTGSINIARSIFRTGEKILPYGTTAHPNILAGSLVILTMLWLKLRDQRRENFTWQALVFVTIISWTLFLTQSYSAIIALAVFFIFQSLPKIKHWAPWLAGGGIIAIPLMLFFMPLRLQSESLLRRNFLNTQAIAVITKNPLDGVGLSAFSTTLKTPAANQAELVRFVQPVHNVFLLLLTETGWLGLGIFFLTVKHFKNTEHWYWLVALIPLLSLDHYLVTQWAGMMMLGLLLGSRSWDKN